MHFVGVSSTHADYKPPPLSALWSAVDGHVVNKVEDTIHICHDSSFFVAGDDVFCIDFILFFLWEERFPQPQLETRCGAGGPESVVFMAGFFTTLLCMWTLLYPSSAAWHASLLPRDACTGRRV